MVEKHLGRPVAPAHVFALKCICGDSTRLEAEETTKALEGSNARASYQAQGYHCIADNGSIDSCTQSVQNTGNAIAKTSKCPSDPMLLSPQTSLRCCKTQS